MQLSYKAIAVLVLALLATLSFLKIYIPNRVSRLQAEQEEAVAVRRIQRLRLRLNRLQKRSEELEAGARSASEEAIRESLRVGKEGELILQAPVPVSTFPKKG